ncbi:hypothetical protein D918_02385 [Trichuris suis]|nr:hypothetical protein D918_02385 [Trichuris suis]
MKGSHEVLRCIILVAACSKRVSACREKMKLSRWIVFLIPKMETGDNLGVVTQEAALSLANQIIDSTNALLKWIFEYRAQRSKLLMTFMSCPFIEEKKEGILSFDRAEVESLIVSLKGLIYSFVSLSVCKNSNSPVYRRICTTSSRKIWNK